MKREYIDLDFSKDFSFNLDRIRTSDIQVEVFEPGKFANAYVEYPDNIQYVMKVFSHCFEVRQSATEGSIKLYLPNDKEYSLEIKNLWGKCSIRNGNFFFLNIKAKNIFLENVKARRGKIQCGNALFSSVILKNSTMDEINSDSEKIDVSNSKIRKINSKYANININKNSIIDELNISALTPEHSCFEFIMNAKDSTIKKINNKMISLNLENCNIGDIECEGGETKISNCHFITPNTIEISRHCKFYFKEQKQYIVKKNIFDQIKICDKENKKEKTKVYVNNGLFSHNQIIVVNTAKYLKTTNQNLTVKEDKQSKIKSKKK